MKSLNWPKALFFDMDGVIYDSMGHHADAWSRAFGAMGFTFPREEVYLNEGRTGSGTIHLLYNRELGRDATPEEVETIYSHKTHFFSILPPVERMAGALELMQQLKQHQIDIWVVTGSQQPKLIDRLLADFHGYVDAQCLITGFDVEHGKPHPEPYLKALEKSGYRSSEVMVLENAPLGVEAAKAAGIFTLAINTGILPDKVLLDAGANHVVKEMSDVWDFIAAGNSLP